MGNQFARFTDDYSRKKTLLQYYVSLQMMYSEVRMKDKKRVGMWDRAE